MPLATGLYYFAHNEDLTARPPVILIHGAGSNHLSWPAEVRRLPDQRIYALDLPGHGKSEGIGRQLIDDYAQTVREFYDAVGISKAVIVGHSMGGAVALAFTLRFPRRVLGLGLVGSGARLRVAPDLLEAAANPATYQTAIQTVIEWSFGPAADAQLKLSIARRMSETRPAVFYGDLLACSAFDVSHQVKRIKAPAVVMCGGLDKMTPLRYSEYLCGQMPNARLRTIFDAGHMLVMERPDEVAEILLEFLKGIDYQPGS